MCRSAPATLILSTAVAKRQPIVTGLDPDIKRILTLHREVVAAALAAQRASREFTSRARCAAADARLTDARRNFNHNLRDMQEARRAEKDNGQAQR